MVKTFPEYIHSEPSTASVGFLPPGRPAAQPPRSQLRRLTSALITTLFPTKCRACGTLFRPPAREDPPAMEDESTFRTLMGPFLCPDCRDGFTATTSPLCPACGEIFVSRQGADHLCGACIEKPRKFHKARAAGIYEDGLLKAVHCLKYKGRIELARPLGRVLFSSFQRHWQPDEIDILLPVPLHRRRMRNRGFNQSLLLLRDWPRHMAAAGGDAAGIQIAPQLLTRSKATPPQIGLGRKERRKNLRGAFTVTAPDQVKKKRILLVDDVYTTGATADACAAALRRAGAARVEVLTLARTLSR